MRWEDPARADLIVDRLRSMVARNDQGEITLLYGAHFLGIFDTCIDILARAAGFASDVPQVQRPVLVRRAVLKAAEEGDLTPGGVLRRLSAEQRRYLQAPVRRFVLLTSISCAFRGGVPKHRRIGTSVLTFARARPKQFGLPDGGSLAVRDETPPRYTYVKVAVLARDGRGAGELAFDHVDFLRALWNLHINRGSFRQSFGSVRRPVNVILPGPRHTVHLPSGTVALPGQWWHSPVVTPGVMLSAERFNRIARFERYVRRRLAGTKLREALIELLVRYVRALDDVDMTVSFTRLWAVLERITGTEGRYDVTVRRASFLWDDPQFARAVLEHLRYERNLIVHEGSWPDQAERMVYQVKRFVEVLIMFLIERAREFPTLAVFHELLDLPSEAQQLRRRLQLHKLALELHRR